MNVAKVILISILAGASFGCADPNSGGLGSNFEVIHPMQSLEVADTYRPTYPEEYNKDGRRIVKGVTKFENVTFSRDSKNSTILLDGVMSIAGDMNKKFRLKMSGSYTQDGEAVLHTLPESKSELPSEVKVGAKVICLDVESKSCEHVIVDIFVRDGETIYFHQVEARDAQAAPKPAIENEKYDDDYTDTGSEDTGEPGPYVGTQKIEEIEAIIKQGEEEQKKTPTPPAKNEKKSDTDSAQDSKDSPNKNDTSSESKPDEKKDTEQSPNKKDSPPTTKTDESKSPVPQAIGSPAGGWLVDASDFTNVKNKNVLLLREFRKRHYGTKELFFVINKMADDTAQLANKKLVVGDLSAQKGGVIGTHKSHQNGLDVDLGYMIRGAQHFINVTDGKKLTDGLLLYQQWELFKRTVATGYIDRIFLHRDLKNALCELAKKKNEVNINTQSGLAFETLRRLIPDTDHNSHYHLRIKCSSQQKRCRQMADPPRTMGCGK